MKRHLLLSGVAALAVAAVAHPDLTGIEAEVQMIDIGGVPHAIVEVFAAFSVSTNTVLNAFNMNYTLTGAPGYVQMNSGGGPSWDPKFSLPAGNQNPSDSLARIGGLVGSVTNTTNADPNWGFAGFNQPGIPANAGWFNTNPPNLQGQAGADLKTPLSRHVFILSGTVTLAVSGKMTFNNGTGTPSSQPEFSATFEVELPGSGVLNDDCADAIAVTVGVPIAYDNVDATPDGPSPCFSLGTDLWYTYTAPITGWVDVSTCDSTFESVISVYEGCGCPASPESLVTCSGCCCGPMGTQFQFVANAGQCYLIQIGGEGGGTGTGTLLVQQDLADCNGNQILDWYETQQGLSVDCDLNNQPDECQLAGGDADGNGVLDLCETPPTVVLGPIVNPATCHRYFLLGASNWTLSQQAAESLGGTLAIVNDDAENMWIWDTFSPTAQDLWIGLSDAVEEGVFVWTDGTPVTYSNWTAGEPNNFFNEDFVHLWSFDGPGKWNDRPNLFNYASGVVEVTNDADLNDDGVVDGADLGSLLSAWGTADPEIDLDCSGVVDGADLGVVLAGWG